MSTYLMVWSAYFAVVLSGEVSGLVVLLSGPAIAASWYWEAPRVNVERWSRWWSGATLLYFIYSLVMILGSGDFLLTASSFITFLLVTKMFNRRTPRDYLHVYILAFLMLVAGTVLNSELTYGIFFLGFVIASTWALTLFHLRREMEDNFLLKHSDSASSERVQVARILNSRRIVGGRFFVGTSMVSVTIFLSAALLFLLIPRIGFGMFFNKSRSGIHLAGFSDGVKLGGHGLIKNDSTVVMRVTVDEPYQGREAPYIHWRGVAFDEYSGGQWRRSKRAPVTTRDTRNPAGARVNRHYLKYHQSLTWRQVRERADAGTRQEIYLEPLGYDVIFGASMPLMFEFDDAIGGRTRARKGRNDEIRHPHSAGIKYVVYSDLERPPAETLRAAGDGMPEKFEAYLQMPDGQITERVKQRAKEITAGAATNYDKAVAIETWLRENLGYTLQMESPGDREPIDFFLFERRTGHCEYFSSAMAIMLRVVGIPSRNVNGFLGGEWNEYDDYIAVRAGDAHSWVEVYFDGVGWVTFDPTPPGESDVLGRGDGGLWNKLRRIADTLRFKWFKWVIEYDLGRQLGLFRSIGRSIKKAVKSVFSFGDGGARAWLKRNKKILAGLIGSVIGAIVLIGWWRRRRDPVRETAVARRRRKRAIDPVMRAYLSARGRYQKLGHKRARSTTPREHARALAKKDVPGAPAFVVLTELYYRAVWSGAELEGDTGDRARELLAAIESAVSS
jgi:transglutaminase-like putative cysteine protease